MNRRFGELGPPEYDRWRRAAEFHQIEKPLVLDLLSASRHESILDLGCGTGVWLGILGALWPSASLWGVDISSGMLAFARREASGKARLVAADCCALTLKAKFDLIISAMSADYIGFQCIATLLCDCLASKGRGLVWVLDPSRYEVTQGLRVKKWMVGDRELQVSVPAFDPEEVQEELRKCNLTVVTRYHAFSLSDGVERRLIFYDVYRSE